MALNFRTKKFIKDNDIQDIKKLEKELRTTLRLDYDMKASDIYKLNFNEVVEKYLEFREQEQIGGNTP